MSRRSTFVDAPVTYGAVGATRAVDLLTYPPRGFRPLERRVRLGSGPERFRLASASLMTLGVQRASGMRVSGLGDGQDAVAADPVADGPSSGESVFSGDGTPYVTRGMSFLLTVPVPPLRFRAPVRIVYVVDEPERVGFAYGTLPGHPVSGEESFLLELADDGAVWFTIRSFSRPANVLYRILTPFVRRQQTRYVGRYLRALLPGRG